MEEVYQLVRARNARETIPFQSIYAAYEALQRGVDTLQLRCDVLEYEQRSEEWAAVDKSPKDGRWSSLKNETNLKEKVDRLQHELDEKLKIESDNASFITKVSTDLNKLREENEIHETTVSSLREEVSQSKTLIRNLTNEVDEARNRARLAEIQFDGLKATIETLQEQNDEFRKSNESFVGRLVTEKEKSIEQMNEMTELVDKLKREVDMLRVLLEQEEKRKFWKDGAGHSVAKSSDDSDMKNHRRFGATGVIIPSTPKVIVRAHPSQGTCLRYDSSGSDLLATASEDSTVKLWETGNGTLKGTFKGTGTGNTILGMDISGGIITGGGTDKMCRVWSTRTERMIHQLVGHSLKVTCIRLYDGEKTIVSGSADRCFKIWDITKATYKQTLSLRHSSTSNCIDVWSSSSVTAASGHLDGAIRLWDLRLADRTMEINDLHIGGCTSVQFNPENAVEILSLGRDSQLKLVDIRNRAVLHTFQHADFRVDLNYASSSISPDGKYAIAGSTSSGELFVWNTSTGALTAKLPGHGVGVVAVTWGRGGTNGQQVASIDKNGSLIFWA